MYNYKSRKLKSIDDTIIFSFDIEDSDDTQLSFGISSSAESSITNKNIYLLKDTIFQENKITSEICTYKEDGKTILINYGDLLFGREYLILSPLYDLDKNTFTWSFYIQNDNPSEKASKIYKDNKIYERINNSTCVLSPIFIEDYCFTNDIAAFTDEPCSLIGETENRDSFILCFDYQISIEQSEKPTSTVILMSSDDQSKTFFSGVYYTNSITSNNSNPNYPNRLRFIISNKARDFSISSYNNTLQKYENSATYIFTDDVNQNNFTNVSVRFSKDEKSVVSNMACNF